MGRSAAREQVVDSSGATAVVGGGRVDNLVDSSGATAVVGGGSVRLVDSSSSGWWMTEELQGRYARVTGITDPAHLCYTEGPTFDSLATAPDSSEADSVAHNRVLFVPGLLTPAECQALVSDVEARHAAMRAEALPPEVPNWMFDADEDEEVDETAGDAQDVKTWGSGLQRHMIQDLSQDTQNLFNEVLHQRLLPFVSKELPLVEKMIWDQLQVPRYQLRCHELSEQPFRFSSEEPAINRYGVGGDFKPHTDKFALTLNILLTVGTFEGGGTEFWTEPNLGQGAAGHSRPECVTEEPALRVLPNTVGVGVLLMVQSSTLGMQSRREYDICLWQASVLILVVNCSLVKHVYKWIQTLRRLMSKQLQMKRSW